MDSDSECWMTKVYWSVFSGDTPMMKKGSWEQRVEEAKG